MKKIMQSTALDKQDNTQDNIFYFSLMAILGEKKQEQNSLQYLVNYLLGSYHLYASTNY